MKGAGIGLDKCRTPLVSVIVPVYNTRRWLKECVDSLLDQTWSRQEIILVDDGSTDGSGELCDRLAAVDNRIRVIHQPNAGLSGARNSGLEAASGEYIIFVDSDDVVPPKMIESMILVALDYDVKIVQGEMVKTVNPSSHVLKESKKTPKIFTSTEGIAEALYQKEMNNSACGKIYHSSLWETLRFRPVWFEDLDIFYRIFSLAERVALIDTPVYLYRQHPDSFIQKFNPSQLNVLDVTDRLYRWVIRNSPKLREAAKVRRLSAHINIYGLMAANKIVWPDVKERCEQVIRRDLPEISRNRNAKSSLRLASLIFKIGGISLLRKALKTGYRHQHRSK